MCICKSDRKYKEINQKRARQATLLLVDRKECGADQPVGGMLHVLSAHQEADQHRSSLNNPCYPYPYSYFVLEPFKNV